MKTITIDGIEYEPIDCSDENGYCGWCGVCVDKYEHENNDSYRGYGHPDEDYKNE